MPTLSSTQATVIGFIVAPILFVACAYFSRANKQRILAALAGSAAYSMLNFVWDQAAEALGWWNYPGYSADGKLPLTLYILAGIAGGGAMSFIGWRVLRRWGRRGLLSWVLLWMLYAVLHDYGGSKTVGREGLMVFGPSPIPILADILQFVALSTVPLVVMRFIAGPADAGGLARPAHSDLQSSRSGELHF